MMGLSDGRKSFPIGLAVLIQYRRVTATHPASHPATQPASHVAVAITLYAKASSAKTTYWTVRKILPEIYLWTKKSPLNFGSHPDRDSDLGFVKMLLYHRGILALLALLGKGKNYFAALAEVCAV